MIKIVKKGEFLFVSSPYAPALPAAAKRIGGKWNGLEWTFDARDEDRVRTLYADIFGKGELK